MPRPNNTFTHPTPDEIGTMLVCWMLLGLAQSVVLLTLDTLGLITL
jgi:hypothetical protein